MQIQASTILNFSNFYQKVKTEKMSIKTSYKLARLASAVETEIGFYREKFQSIIQTYGEFDENGQVKQIENGAGIKIRPGSEIECAAALNELETLEITLPDISFTLDEFENLSLSPDEIASILPFIQE
jgi:hypothetical protein